MSVLAPFMPPESFLGLLASAALKGTLLLLVALLLDLTLRRHTAALRHRVWTAGFAALLLVPLAAPLAPDWSLPLLPAQLAPAGTHGGGGQRSAIPPTQAAGARETSAVAERAGASSDSAPDDPSAISTVATLDAASRARATPWAALAISVWAVGAMLLLSQLGIGAARASRLCRRARRLDEPAWSELLERARKRLGLRASVRLVLSDTVDMPMAWGVLRHHVVLPADAEHWSNERREVVLLHELAHIRRGDCLAHLLSGCAAALYWPHPLVWIARRRQVAERELACDDIVLISGARGADYAWHLLEIARASAARLELAPAGVTMARPSQLEGRLLAALDGSRDRRRLSRLGAAMPTAAGLLTAVALAGLQPWATPAAQESEARELTAQAPGRPAPPDAERGGVPVRERVTRMFVDLLDDSDVSIRRQAVHSLGQMEDAAAVAALAETVVGDDDAGVREQAAWALGRIESPDAVEALGRALGDAEAKVRRQAAWALGMIESPDGVAALAATLRQDGDAGVREQAAWALGMIEDEAALEAVIDAVEDENAAVRKQALWAVSRIVG